MFKRHITCFSDKFIPVFIILKAICQVLVESGLGKWDAATAFNR